MCTLGGNSKNRCVLVDAPFGNMVDSFWKYGLSYPLIDDSIPNLKFISTGFCIGNQTNGFGLMCEWLERKLETWIIFLLLPLAN